VLVENNEGFDRPANLIGVESFITIYSHMVELEKWRDIEDHKFRILTLSYVVYYATLIVNADLNREERSF
jgi:hypothetical protein